MEKIYNNLNIENLSKTEWFNQFNNYQREQIIKGLEDNLDISVYAKTDFTGSQMTSIRLGLIDNLDVSIYAKTKFNWFEMEGIRKNLLKKVHFYSVLFFYSKKQFFKNIFVCLESISNFRC